MTGPGATANAYWTVRSVAADSAWVETLYVYEPVSLQPKVVEIISSDGSRRRTETTYAHEIYSGMGRAGRHQLTAVHELVIRESGGAPALSCSATEFRQLQGQGWVPDRSFEGCGPERSLVGHFVTYDLLGRPREIVSPTGVRGIITYSGRHVIAIRQEHTRWSSGQAEVVALQETFGYDSRGRLQRSTDVNGVSNFYGYDGLGRLSETRHVSSIGPLVAEHEYQFSQSGESDGSYDPANPNRVRTRLHSGFSAAALQTLTTYLDGLGRQLQSHVRNGTWSVVTLGEYDELGRPSRAWRPVMINNSAQLYVDPENVKSWAMSSATSQYGQEYGRYGTAPGNGIDDENRPFSETRYEASPLSRVVATRAPGRKPSTVSSSPYAGSGATVVQEYGVSAPAWEGQPRGPKLAYSETRDAEERWTRTYSDGLGRSRFISRGQGQSQETLTEMLYDAADRLLEVRPPHYFDPPANSTASDWRTRYTYDTRGLLLEKRTPDTRHWSDGGPGRYRYKYDEFGRLRYSQNPGQRGTGHVAFRVYDPLGRIDYEGVGRPDVCKTTATRESCWAQLDPAIATRIPDASRPTCTYPDGTPCHWEWMSDNWRAMYLYDDPSQKDGSGARRVEGWPFNGDPAFAYLRPRGRPVAVAYRTDGLWASDGGAWETTLFAYDRDGNVIRRWVRHSNMAPEWAKYTYTYSRQGHLIQDIVELGSHALRHDYRYNARGFLASVKAFNNGSGLGTTRDVTFSNAADGSLFRMQFRGNTTDNREVRYRHDVAGRMVDIGDVDVPTITFARPFSSRLIYTPGGLIGRQDWLTPHSVKYCPSGYPANACSARSHIKYAYDALGRLTTANHVPQGSAPTAMVGYDLRNVSYDRQGNVLTLLRRAPATNGSWRDMHDLRYAYVPAMNRLRVVNDRLWSADSWDSSFSYDRNGNVNWIERYYDGPGGLVEDYYLVNRIDERNLPERISHFVGPRTPSTLHYDYAYDPAGQRIRKVRRSTSSGGSNDPHYQADRYLREGQRTVGVLDGEGGLRWWNLGGAAGVHGRIERGEAFSGPEEDDDLIALSVNLLAGDEEAESQGDPSAGAAYRGPRQRTLTGVLGEELQLAGIETADARHLARTLAPRLADELSRASRQAATQSRAQLQERGGSNLGREVYSAALPVARRSIARSLEGSGLTPVSDSLIERISSAVAGFAATAAANETGRARAARELERVGLQLPEPLALDTLSHDRPMPSDEWDDPFREPEPEEEEIALMSAGTVDIYHWRYYISDHLGSIRVVLDANGAVIEARDYYPYGLTMPGRSFVQGQATREGFTAYELDQETGFYYAGARYYMPSLGRFAATDRFQELYPDLNPYQYAGNNPVSIIDVNGDTLRAVHMMGLSTSDPVLRERIYYVDQTIADNVVSFVDQARDRFPRLSVNNTFRTQASSTINTTNRRATGLSRHQAGFAIDLNGVWTLSISDLQELNTIAAQHGLAPLRDQQSDLPHFSADPTAHGYASIEDAVRENLAHYRVLTAPPPKTIYQAQLPEITVTAPREDTRLTPLPPFQL